MNTRLICVECYYKNYLLANKSNRNCHKLRLINFIFLRNSYNGMKNISTLIDLTKQMILKQEKLDKTRNHWSHIHHHLFKSEQHSSSLPHFSWHRTADRKPSLLLRVDKG